MQKEERAVNVWVAAAFIIYLGFIVGIGFIFSKKSSDMSDYFLGGRGMGSWLTALSAQASDMSSWLLMGLPGAVYISGLSAAWIAIGLGLGTYLNWRIVAKRLRKYSYITGDSITIPQFLQNRFNAASVSVRIVCAVIIFVFFLIYTASGFNAAAKLIENVFGLDYKIGLTIGVIVIMLYTFMGGYFAVVWTDFFQGMLMFFALMIVPIIVYMAVDKSVFDTMVTSNSGYFSLFGGDVNRVSIQEIISNLGWGLGYFGMPHILVRFMSIKSSSLIKKSRIIAMVWVVITLAASVAVGIVGFAYLKQEAIVLESAAEAEKIFMKLVQMVAPAFIAGILLCAIVSAIMSTSDSQLLVTASAVSNDIYKTLFRKEAGNKELLFVSRLAVILISAVAYVIALDPEATVMGLVSYAWAGFGAAFGPVMLFALFWKRMTMYGAIAGMLSGGVCVVVWNKFLAQSTGIYELVPAFIISCAFIVVVSLIDKEPSKEVVETFNKVSEIEI